MSNYRGALSYARKILHLDIKYSSNIYLLQEQMKLLTKYKWNKKINMVAQSKQSYVSYVRTIKQ